MKDSGLKFFFTHKNILLYKYKILCIKNFLINTKYHSWWTVVPILFAPRRPSDRCSYFLQNREEQRGEHNNAQ